ncbi:5'/3'-nucleotidase SurE [Halobium salinum]|uniref:5'-nucleotidase SurE n=1 Tax=Halobium salinum TaxID=1364940 RepID=A0ABD5P8W2_9EURY|nr:5'/3'-nucleotidase SurE [Halobium salinum]
MSDTSEPRILVTNDDGIDAPGIASLYEELSALGEVTVVAPATNQSGVGRTRNGRATVREHPWGYALAGTPADCVAFGLGGGLADDDIEAPGVDVDGTATHPFDVVVSGVNDGPNAGNYVVGRSGTVGAGIEAAFLGVPAVAVSAYHTELFHPDAEQYDFNRPARVARRFVERGLESGVFDEVDVLNLNAPVDAEPTGTRVTRPVADYGQRVSFEAADGGESVSESEEDRGSASDEDERAVRLVDRSWPHIEGFENPFPGAEEHRHRYPEDGDRVAMMDGAVSVSPLSVGHEHLDSATLAGLVEDVDLG